MLSQDIERRVTQLIGLTRMLKSGFTIIEVLMVILILGIAAAVVVPMASSAGSMQVRAAANMVAADLEYAKSMAISRGQAYAVKFDTTNEVYRVVVDVNEAEIWHPVKKGFKYIVDFKNDGRLDRVNIVSTNFGGKVKFDYLGTPYDNSGTALGAAGAIRLQSGNITKYVNVEPTTGFITIN